MRDLNEANDIIMEFLRLDTHPLAVKFIKSDEGVPDKARNIRDLGIKIALCQATSIARRFGWIIAVSPNDINCASGLLGFGWGELTPGLNREEELVNFLVSAGYVKDAERAKKSIEALPPLKNEYTSQYSGLVISPLKSNAYESVDVILMYGNAAQLSRMIQSYVYIMGGTVKSESNVGLSCVAEMIQPMVDKTARYVIPGRGERSLGMAGNDEVAFALPGEQLDDFLTGLQETHKAGSRYPIIQYLFFEPVYTPAILEFRNKIHTREVGQQE
jgi:uncharacterized protein (DUF169 family)